MRTITIGHLSHGITHTGGYLHEQSLLRQLSNSLTAKGYRPVTETARAGKVFKGAAHLQLLWWSFMQARFDINIVVARCALSAIIRNIFNARKIIIVLHYFDEGDHKGFALSLYYRLLFWWLRTFKSRNVSICAVAPFWVDYFKTMVNSNVPVVLYPNLFDTETYKCYRTLHKKKQVHLGQYSAKNSGLIFGVAAQLTQQGYTCYFTTLSKELAGTHAGYEIRYVPFEQYLGDMAESEYTLAYTRINEGWNRIAHESILVGTDVIGVNKGGLGNLLMQSGSLIANSEQDFVRLVTTQAKAAVKPGFITEYDNANVARFMSPILSVLGL